ncbi:CHAT domain-containing protein [Yinghuangia seranimata]|uniref:CHAT domain-containing protein n=1 Tax=Yinghuangia seranimata TaxID=408067 RepID=UPI00248CF2DA|nr:CHAT domain-containing protein [Yinghuangia seranimata]MDI2129854.1 CHAT domain-containing protein [Yinghuangia seranimata]
MAERARALAAEEAPVGTLLVRLLVRAVGLAPGSTRPHTPRALATPAARTALAAWIDVSAYALADVGDPAVLDAARAASESLVAYHRAHADPAGEARARLMLARTLIHVYCAGRQPATLAADDATWREHSRRRREARGASEEELEREMPSWRDGLAEASRLVEAALPALQGAEHAYACYDLIKLLDLRRGLDGSLGAEAHTIAGRVLDLARAAVPYLDPDDAPVQRLMVLDLTVRHGGEVSRRDVDELLGRWPDDIAYRTGDQGALDAGWHLAALLRRGDPPRALAVMTETARLARRLGERDRRQALTQEVILIGLALAPGTGAMVADLGWAGAVTATTARLDGVGRLGRADADVSVPTGDPRAGIKVPAVTAEAATLVELARRSSEFGEPSTGRRLLETAEQVCPHLVARHPDALRMLHARLLMDGAAETAESDPARAAAELDQAIRLLLRLGLPETALTPFHALADLLHANPKAPKAPTSPAAFSPVVDALVEHAGALERRCGTQGRSAVRLVAGTAVSALLGTHADPDDVLRITSVLKGAQYAAALADPAALRARFAAAGSDAALLELQAALGADPAAATEDAGDNDFDRTLFTSYPDAPPPVDSGGKTNGDPAQRVANLQRAYDQRLIARVFDGAGAYRPLLSTDVSLALPGGTVLLDLTASALPNGNLGLYWQIFAGGSNLCHCGVVPFELPYPGLPVATDGVESPRFAPLAPQVMSTREHLRVDPGRMRPVSTEGGKRLRQDALDLIGEDGLGVLAALHEAGWRSLCVSPHGPLHFYPWHLLEHRDGAMLCDDWTVTVLPNRGLLRPAVGQPRLARPPVRMLTCLGMGFAADSRPGARPLPHAPGEARDVAALFDGQALVLTDEACTDRAVLDALQESCYVHITTRGRHHAAAPSLHGLYFTPTDDTTGRVTAADLVGLDLRGVDVVTMSVCETSLGRVDDGDNPRGLPGALLLAGVRTVVGTLWPIGSATARMFFVRFYGALRDGDAKPDAFRAAQEHTRKAFPQYRDWGAFVYYGAP